MSYGCLIWLSASNRGRLPTSAQGGANEGGTYQGRAFWRDPVRGSAQLASVVSGLASVAYLVQARKDPISNHQPVES